MGLGIAVGVWPVRDAVVREVHPVGAPQMAAMDAEAKRVAERIPGATVVDHVEVVVTGKAC